VKSTRENPTGSTVHDFSGLLPLSPSRRAISTSEGEEEFREDGEKKSRLEGEAHEDPEAHPGAMRDDIVITTAPVPGQEGPRDLWTGRWFESMKLVVVSTAAESGGNCELTQAGER